VVPLHPNLSRCDKQKQKQLDVFNASARRAARHVLLALILHDL
jgi:hypothetical protein